MAPGEVLIWTSTCLECVTDVDDECTLERFNGVPLAIVPSNLQALHIVDVEQQRHGAGVRVRRQAQHIAGLPARRVVGHLHGLRLAPELLQEALRLHGSTPMSTAINRSKDDVTFATSVENQSTEFLHMREESESGRITSTDRDGEERTAAGAHGTSS